MANLDEEIFDEEEAEDPFEVDPLHVNNDFEDIEEEEIPRGLQFVEELPARARRRELSAPQIALREVGEELSNLGLTGISTIIEDLQDFEPILYVNPKTFAAAIYMYYQPDEINLSRLTDTEFNQRFEQIKDHLLGPKTDLTRTKTTLLKYLRMYSNYLESES